MLAEAMIATKGIFMSKHFASKGGDGGRSISARSDGFMRGGLVGVVNRSFTNSAIKTATSNGGRSLSGKAYTSSVSKGDSFVNTVIGKVATGDMQLWKTMSKIFLLFKRRNRRRQNYRHLNQ